MRAAALPALVAFALAWAGASTAAAASPPLAVPAAASAASAAHERHESPYVRAARQRAMEASATATPKVNPLQQHRPRMPASMHNG